MTDVKQTRIEQLKSSAPYGILLLIIFGLALYIRAVIPYDSVFLADGTIRFGGNDPWYHMRLVHALLHNYPHAMFYDAHAIPPYGCYIHFGPLFDHTIALLSLIIGLGQPTPRLVDTIGAYFPTFLGALVVIPVYFIGKHLHNRGTGLLAALIIATLPGQFLSRSLLGFTDHHVAEVLLSTATIMFFMLALMGARNQNLSLKNLNQDWRTAKYPLGYAVLAGVAYAAYQLCWPGAPLFGAIIVIASIIGYIAEHIRGRSVDYLTMVGITAFGVELILVLPWLHPEMGFSRVYYSLFHAIIPIVAIAAFVLMHLISKEMNRRELNPYYYPVLLIVGMAVGLALMSVISPTLYLTIVRSPVMIFGIHTGGGATIAEASSMLVDRSTGELNIGRESMVYGNFGNCFYVSLFGILLLGYYVVKRWKPEEILVLIWTVVMLLSIYGQNRFAYYYAVNVAIISAYFGTRILGFSGFKGVHTTIEDLPQFLVKNAGYIVLVIIIIGILVYPWGPAPLALKQARYAGGPNSAWYNSLDWMRNNTPETGLSYYGPYERPPPGEPYPYPDTAYFVLSWWDYGHWIEVIGHRIPNANPFQAGIGGGKNRTPGASTFFTAASEEEANAIADTLGTRYVVSDVQMATGKFYAITTWTGDTGGYSEWLPIGDRMELVPTMRYFNSMEGRLHIFDGASLKHYRLVHESMAGNTAERGYKWVYNMQPMLYPDLFENRHQDLPEEIAEADTGYVKIFEYVKGARITGTAPPNSTATLSIPILTNQGRTFDYVQTATATPDGTVTLIAPYSTDGLISIDAGGTQFDTAPSGMYTVTIAGMPHQVTVSEDDVLAGNVIGVA
ncbi:MAG TPA: oligosaccharyl transferase, archaeosortase A system-associated [Methanosarcinales archaeon]|nr:oligosaccharyl transferase, archaeosortase A system-associated [Methanosarcinales archaeon]